MKTSNKLNFHLHKLRISQCNSSDCYFNEKEGNLMINKVFMCKLHGYLEAKIWMEDRKISQILVKCNSGGSCSCMSFPDCWSSGFPGSLGGFVLSSLWQDV